MKRLSCSLAVVILCLLFTHCNQVEAKKESETTHQKDTSLIPVEGAWKLVWAQYNDTLANMANHSLVKMFTDGAFSLFAHDSAGKIKYAGYGKYTFEGNAYHETFLYHNDSGLTGAEDWQNLSIKGDTMYLNGFTKVIVGGKEVTSGFTKVREKLVRVKW